MLQNYAFQWWKQEPLTLEKEGQREVTKAHNHKDHKPKENIWENYFIEPISHIRILDSIVNEYEARDKKKKRC
jgi:hypothetical protein